MIESGPALPARPLPGIHILTVAELDWRNGYEFALQAIQLLQHRGHKIVYSIVGNGDFLEAVCFARHELGLDKHVNILLHPSKKELEHLYQHANIFLLASVAPVSHHALADALVYGLPIVITDILQIDKSFKLDNPICVAARRSSYSLADCLEKMMSGISMNGTLSF